MLRVMQHIVWCRSVSFVMLSRLDYTCKAGKYVNQVGSRGQETLRLGSEGCWSEGWVAAARGPQNGHSEPHSSYNIHMSQLQFARASVIQNVETHRP